MCMPLNLAILHPQYFHILVAYTGVKNLTSNIHFIESYRQMLVTGVLFQNYITRHTYTQNSVTVGRVLLVAWHSSAERTASDGQTSNVTTHRDSICIS